MGEIELDKDDDFITNMYILKILIILGVMVAIIGYWSGWFLLPLSSLALSLKASPGLLVLWVLTLAVSAYLLYLGYKKENELYAYLAIGIPFIVLIISPFVQLLSVSAVGQSIKVVYLKSVPDLYGIYRIIPLPTAYAYASDRIQIPTHTIYYDESYVYYNGTTPVYNWIIEPEGFLNSITREPIGAIFIYGDRYPPDVKIVKQKLTWGLHNVRLTPFVADTLALELTIRGAFGKELLWEDVADVLYKGEILQVVPVVDYVMRFPGALPIVKGYFVVYPNGTIRFVKPVEVSKFNVPILPEKVARQWVEALRLRNWVQAVFYHNTFEIRDVGDNPQPYLLPDSKGNLWWVFVAEPPGNTYSAYMLILVKANEVKPVVYIYKFRRPEIGISKVRSYVMKAHPNWAWDQLLVQEPMPSMFNGTLLWKVSITTLDSRGLISVDFLNATSGNVLSFPVKNRLTAKTLLEGLEGWNKVVQKPTKEKLTLQQLLEKIKKIKQELEDLEKLVEEMIRKGNNVTR